MAKGKTQFVKKGGGSLYMDGRIIKPNQKFWAFPSQIPENFRDVIVPANPKKTFDEAVVKEKQIKGTYTLNGRSNGKYDILGPSGKVLNTQPLDKDEADAMIKKLE